MAPRIETAEDLERIVAEQTAAITAMGELVKLQQTQILTLTALVDKHHQIFTEAGLAKPRPAGGTPIVH